MPRSRLKWLLPVCVLLGLTLWVAADVAHNRSFEAVPARPAERMVFSEDRLLWALANDEPMPAAAIDAHISGACTFIAGATTALTSALRACFVSSIATQIG